MNYSPGEAKYPVLITEHWKNVLKNMNGKI